MLGGVPLTGAAVATAPGKAILLGEHFVVHGTGAILCAIDRRARASARRTDGEGVVVRSALGCAKAGGGPLSEIRPEFRPFVYIARDVIERHGEGRPFEGGVSVCIDSDIPAGVGLGSSSACCVAAVASVSRLSGTYSPRLIWEVSVRSEKTVSAEFGGRLARVRDDALRAERQAFLMASGADTTASTWGGIIEYNQSMKFEPIYVRRQLDLIVADSMQPHVTRDMVDKVSEFRKSSPGEFRSLCTSEARLIARARKALEAGDMGELGRCMSENQSYLERIGVSNDRLRKMIDAAGGATYGAKITGAGGGGCIIALARDGRRDEAIRSLRSLGCRCFSASVDYEGVSEADG